MEKKEKIKTCSIGIGGSKGCCKVESVVSVDERGQMVLPKELRDKADIRAGDKLAVVGMEKEGKICCVSLIKIGEIEEMLKSMLGPVMKEMFKD
ncbi:MAG: HgcAB-associated protein [Candidatus Aminicenantes bacterium]|nr:HgcAB-associated protein [Candidatus Aminicenantes bacterium]